jgi:hypothetical protein
MRVGITGSTGFLGTALSAALDARGDDVVRFVRPSSNHVAGKVVRWDPERSLIDEGDLKSVGGFDAVVNLAGTGIASHRWNAAYRRGVMSRCWSAARPLATTVTAARRP